MKPSDRILLFAAILCMSLPELTSAAESLPTLPSTMPADDDNRNSNVVRHFSQHSQQHPNGRAAFTIDVSAWTGDIRNLPIGIFDSGIGGLTVLEAILAMDQFHNETLSPGPDGRRDFENERFIYLGDQANMPYGNYPSADREEFLKELILKDAAFLLGRRYWETPESQNPRFDKPPVKAIVIACNTATAWGLEEIRQVIAEWKIPVVVIGVVEAGARGVLELPIIDGRQRTVAVLATVGTCRSNAYSKAISQTMGLAGKRIPHVVQQGSVGLAGAIEGDPAFVAEEKPLEDGVSISDRRSYQGPSAGNSAASLNPSMLSLYGFDSEGLTGDAAKPETLRLNSVANYVRYDVTELVRNHRDSGSTAVIDTVVLGCTHFPLVETEIRNAFERLRCCKVDGVHPFQSLIAETIDIVNPAEMTARELFRELARNRRFSQTRVRENPPLDLFFISVANPGCSVSQRAADGSLDTGYKYGRRAGQLQTEDTICVPMQVRLLSPASVNLIGSRLPQVWVRLNPVP